MMRARHPTARDHARDDTSNRLNWFAGGKGTTARDARKNRGDNAGSTGRQWIASTDSVPPAATMLTESGLGWFGTGAAAALGSSFTAAPAGTTGSAPLVPPIVSLPMNPAVPDPPAAPTPTDLGLPAGTPLPSPMPAGAAAPLPTAPAMDTAAASALAAPDQDGPAGAKVTPISPAADLNDIRLNQAPTLPSVSPPAGGATDPAAAPKGISSLSADSLTAPSGAQTFAATQTSNNPIVLENEKPGTPQSVWQVDPGQDSTRLEGFTTAMSTDLGGAVNFKIDNTTGNGNYPINIYRLGYYGGDGATLVATLQHTGLVSQPAAITDPATGEVDAGNWSVTDSWQVPTTATSGVYVAYVTQGSQVFQIPFVVRDDASTSDIVFQTSDETWQAYNGWGGANLYGGNGPSDPPPNSGGEASPGAAFAVSYNRPIVTRDGVGLYAGPQDSLFGAEYSAIYWLEANGYNVSYISGLDTSSNGALLLNHKVFMDDGHDEYWTNSQLANVQAAQKAGVNMAFLSGNEIFWQTQFTPSIDGTNTAGRTLTSYKDSHFETLINPTGQGTGTFESPVSWGGLGLPSNALTGQLFSVDQTADNTAITIPYGETRLRLWRNTGVAATAPGGTASLENGLLGYEWDSSPDNGFMPAGLINLSTTTVNTSVYNSQFGNVDGPGTATHNLVEFRDPTSGALIFGAGTVFWSWGLSSQHDPGPDFNTTTVDPNVQQAMVNLFADMGVQPQTLQASLTLATQSTDHTPPTSTITKLSSNSAVEGGPVTVSGAAADTGGLVGAVQVSTDSGKTWHPATGQFGASSVNWSYTFNAPAPGSYSIETRAVDDSLNTETPGAGSPYTVTRSSALTLFAANAVPAVASVASSPVEVGVCFTSSSSGLVTGVRFYKGTANTGTHIGDLWSSSGQLLASATFTNETASGWQQVNFATPVQIQANEICVVSYHTNGNYSDTPGYFDTYSGQVSGSLTGLGNALNGVYAYGSTPIFPNTISFSGDNFWVDPVFNDTGTAGPENPPVANNDNGFVVGLNTPITFQPATLLANDTDPDGDPLTVTGANAPANGTVSFNTQTQAITFTPTTGYVGPASFDYSIADGRGGTASAVVSMNVGAVSLFSPSDAPADISDTDPSQVNLGVRFVASQSGQILGIKYYKGVNDIGTHTGSLWSSTGTLLATATFTNETASGWQTVTFSNPVTITAGTTYVASYHSDGHYAATTNYFTTPHTSGPLTASTSNGLYTYGTGNLFPTSTYQASNYWADVIFSPNIGTDHPPVASNDSGFTTPENTALQIGAATLLANDTDPDGDLLVVTGVSAPSNGSVTFDAQNNVVKFTPTTGYTGSAGFTYAISDGRGGVSSASVSLTVGGTPISSLFAANATPAEITDADPNAVELGVKFVASTDGTITGLRFYKGPQNTGTHTGSLWTSSGQLLGSLTFTNETASGWQTANFATPITITAGTTYVAGYHSNGFYSADGNFFATNISNGPLTAPASGTSGGNGVYTYGSASVFPTTTFNATNYWVDVLYQPVAPGTDTPPVANPDTGFTTNQNTPLQIAAATLLANDTDADGDPLIVTGVSAPSNGTVAFDAQTKIVTFTPTTGYSGPANFTYGISDGRGGLASAGVSLTVSGTTGVSLFTATATPATITQNDPSPVELGMKFTPSTNGTITGIRFYKGPQNTGTHTGTLWTSTGTQLGTLTFGNETASGWQTANFAAPVQVTAGTTYVVGYHSNGYYSANTNYFTSAVSNGPLTAPSSSSSGGNGVYAYGTGSAFPTNSYNASNYWVDVIFNGQLAA
jgi:hypothetical protein